MCHGWERQVRAQLPAPECCGICSGPVIKLHPKNSSPCHCMASALAGGSEGCLFSRSGAASVLTLMAWSVLCKGTWLTCLKTDKADDLTGKTEPASSLPGSQGLFKARTWNIFMKCWHTKPECSRNKAELTRRAVRHGRRFWVSKLGLQKLWRGPAHERELAFWERGPQLSGLNLQQTSPLPLPLLFNWGEPSRCFSWKHRTCVQKAKSTWPLGYRPSCPCQELVGAAKEHVPSTHCMPGTS